jgi:cytoskeletal protein CcmA (bactofilin family)
MKKLAVLLAFVAVALIPVSALAFSSDTGKSLTLDQGQTKTGTYYAVGQDVTIDGTVNGDLICAGQNVTINGTIRGDVICAAQTITISGHVDGSVRAVGQVVNVNSTVGRNGTIAGQTIDIGGQARLAGDLGMLAQTANVNGTVVSDVYGAVQDLSIGSSVGGVAIKTQNLQLTADAHVKGNLTYTSPQSFSISKSQVGGTITHKTVTPRMHHGFSGISVLTLIAYFIVAGWIVAFVLVLAAPRMAEYVTKSMFVNPGARIGIGLSIEILTPVLAVLLMFTLIGIPLAVLLWGIWLLILAFGEIFAAIGIGILVTRWTNWHKGSLLWATGIGIPIAVIVFSIPFIGWLVSLVAQWWAIGGLAKSSTLLGAKASR